MFELHDIISLVMSTKITIYIKILMNSIDLVLNLFKVNYNIIFITIHHFKRDFFNVRYICIDEK